MPRNRKGGGWRAKRFIEQQKREKRLRKLAEKGRLSGTPVAKAFETKKPQLSLKRIGKSNWWPNLTKRIINELSSGGNAKVKTSLSLPDSSRTTNQVLVFDVTTQDLIKAQGRFFGTFLVDLQNATIKRIK